MDPSRSAAMNYDHLIVEVDLSRWEMRVALYLFADHDAQGERSLLAVDFGRVRRMEIPPTRGTRTFMQSP